MMFAVSFDEQATRTTHYAVVIADTPTIAVELALADWREQNPGREIKLSSLQVATRFAELAPGVVARADSEGSWSLARFSGFGRARA